LINVLIADNLYYNIEGMRIELVDCKNLKILEA